MQKILFVTAFLLVVCSIGFSSEIESTDRTVSLEQDITFISAYSPDAEVQLFTSKKDSAKWNRFINWLAEREKLFLYLAIGCTVGTALFFIMGVVGSVLYGVVWAAPPTRLESHYLFYPGVVLMGLGWFFFIHLLVAAITAWIFYALPKIERKNARLRLETTPDSIALSIRL